MSGSNSRLPLTINKHNFDSSRFLTSSYTAVKAKTKTKEEQRTPEKGGKRKRNKVPNPVGFTPPSQALKLSEPSFLTKKLLPHPKKKEKGNSLRKGGLCPLTA
jgi:hypothetical protein